MMRLLIIFLILFPIWSCSGNEVIEESDITATSVAIEEKRVINMIPGQTTAQEIIDCFGQPDEIESKSKLALEVWTYNGRVIDKTKKLFIQKNKKCNTTFYISTMNKNGPKIFLSCACAEVVRPSIERFIGGDFSSESTD